MQISRYSAPEFDPYGDNRQQEPDAGWLAPTATAQLESVVAIPGSKSLTNRELVLAALADGPSTLHAPLWSRDSELMVEGLRALGTRFERMPGTGGFGDDLRVLPADELLGSTTIDCGLAGTVMRFLPPVAALALGPTTFDGDEGARSPSTMSSLSRDQSGARSVDGPSARAASTSSRLVSDFEPGSATTDSSGVGATGASQPSSGSVCLASPYGSNSGAEYLDICIGYQQ